MAGTACIRRWLLVCVGSLALRSSSTALGWERGALVDCCDGMCRPRPFLVLRGGSSAWTTALMQASTKDGQGKLSLVEACGALKPHGLVVNPAQMKDFLGMCGATEDEYVGETHFSAALAKHPPSSALGRWQQKARFQAACSHTISSLQSRPIELAKEVKVDPDIDEGAENSFKKHHEKKRGWASLGQSTEQRSEDVMSSDGSQVEAVIGAQEKTPTTEKPQEERQGGRLKRGSKRLRREAAANAGATLTTNPFAALVDHGEGKGRTLSVEKVEPDVSRKKAVTDQVRLLAADDLGTARRDMRSGTEGKAAGTALKRHDLKELRPLMSLNEWQKLSSAKQRKKIRKLAAREYRQEMLRTQLMNEANDEEFKIESALQVDLGSGRLAAVPTDQRFHTATAGRGMQISQGGLVVRKGPGVSMPTYVFWGSELTEGISRWALRIDRKRSSFYIGVAVLPLDPDEGFAKFLQSQAWMLSDFGVIFQTQQGTSRNPLRDRLVPSPDGGHTVEVNIPSIGKAVYTAKNKYRKHRYAFKDGSLIKMELDREAQTLRFCIDNKQWISLTGVSTYARPFLNFFNAGDGATLLQAEDGRSIRADLV